LFMGRTESLEVELQRFPLTGQYFGKLFRQRVGMSSALDTELVGDILAPGNFARLEALVEHLHHISGFGRIFRPGLSESDPDGPILAIFAEMDGLRYLVQNGYSDTMVEPAHGGKTPEFTATLDGMRCFIEVKSLQKMESQNRLGTIQGSVYIFAPAPDVLPATAEVDVGVRNTSVVNKLIGRRVRDAVGQIEAKATREGVRDWRGIVVVVATRRRTDLDFWDNICFEALRRSCDRIAEMRPTAKLHAGVFISSDGAWSYIVSRRAFGRVPLIP